VSICRVSWASVMWVLDMSHLTSECVVWVSVCWICHVRCVCVCVVWVMCVDMRV
jgi:hypothetical protein